MKKLFKRYKNWSLPSKMTFWGLLLAIISTPLTIIGYFQLFGNDDIANKLYKALQVNARSYIQVKGVNTPTYMNEGKVLVLDIENLSSFQVRNIKTKVLVSKNTELVGKFNDNTLAGKNLGIPPKTTSHIVVLTFKKLNNYIRKEYPTYNIVDIVLLDKQSPHNGLGYPFYVTISYKTDGGEDIEQSVALNAILQKKS